MRALRWACRMKGRSLVAQGSAVIRGVPRPRVCLLTLIFSIFKAPVCSGARNRVSQCFPHTFAISFGRHQVPPGTVGIGSMPTALSKTSIMNFRLPKRIFLLFQAPCEVYMGIPLPKGLSLSIFLRVLTALMSVIVTCTHFSASVDLFDLPSGLPPATLHIESCTNSRAGDLQTPGRRRRLFCRAGICDLCCGLGVLQ